MIKAAKIAISLPAEDLKRIEKIRKESGVQRSFIIDTAIRYWLDSREKQTMIEQYEEGYRHHPESIDEIKAMEEASVGAFIEERLK